MDRRCPLQRLSSPKFESHSCIYYCDYTFIHLSKFGGFLRALLFFHHYRSVHLFDILLRKTLLRKSYALFRESNALLRESYALFRQIKWTRCFAKVMRYSPNKMNALFCERKALLCEINALLRKQKLFYQNELNRLS